MLPPCGLMLTRPGETAIRAGAMFRPWGLTLTPTGDTEMSVCTHIHQVEGSTLYITIHSSVLAAITGCYHANAHAAKHAHAQAQQTSRMPCSTISGVWPGMQSCQIDGPCLRKSSLQALLSLAFRYLMQSGSTTCWTRYV